MDDSPDWFARAVGGGGLALGAWNLIRSLTRVRRKLKVKAEFTDMVPFDRGLALALVINARNPSQVPIQVQHAGANIWKRDATLHDEIWEVLADYPTLGEGGEMRTILLNIPPGTVRVESAWVSDELGRRWKAWRIRKKKHLRRFLR